MTQHLPHQPQPGDPIEIIDVSPLHDHLPAKPADSRAQRVVSTAKANIVRLIPGVTSLPLRPALGAA